MSGFTDGEYERKARPEASGFAQGHPKAGDDKPKATSPSPQSAVRWPWLFGGVLCVVAALIMAALPFVLAQKPAPLDRDGPVPAFSLIDRFGEGFSNDALAGKVWVANFMFTTCPSICPVMSRHLGKLQEAMRSAGLRDDAAIVSFSVQPEVDTPEVLREYGVLHGAEPGFWHLLTGERSAIWSLSKDGFKLHVGQADNPAEPVAHTGKLVLVDQAGVVRGYYDGLTPAVIDELMADIRQLVNEGP